MAIKGNCTNPKHRSASHHLSRGWKKHFCEWELEWLMCCYSVKSTQEWKLLVPFQNAQYFTGNLQWRNMPRQPLFFFLCSLLCLMPLLKASFPTGLHSFLNFLWPSCIVVGWLFLPVLLRHEQGWGLVCCFVCLVGFFLYLKPTHSYYSLCRVKTKRPQSMGVLLPR